MKSVKKRMNKMRDNTQKAVVCSKFYNNVFLHDNLQMAIYRKTWTINTYIFYKLFNEYVK